MNVSTKQWLLALLQMERDETQACVLRCGEEELKSAALTCIDAAIRLVEQGPEEPKP